MAEINAAYDLIHHAPLRDTPSERSVGEVPTHVPATSRTAVLDACLLALRFLVGAALGVVIALLLDIAGVRGFAAYVIAVPFICGCALVVFDVSLSSLLRAILAVSDY